jgi:glyoxylase-like metal-dependent hydrolase (beta-lactamase superfamily II)
MAKAAGAEQFQAWQAGLMPPVERVREGLWSIPVPIPRSSLRYVLVYALELSDGVAIVDAGWAAEESWQALLAGLAVAGFDQGSVRAVLATHVHPDHYGLAGRVRAATGAWIGMHPNDAALAEAVRPDVLIGDGAPVALPGWELQAIWTPGHTRGHLCFYEPRSKLLLAGDHVLPRITPHVGAHARQSPDPLGDFLTSLQAVAGLDVAEVLPAHEYRFYGLADRVAELAAHHEERLAAVAAVVAAASSVTCGDVAAALPWSRPLAGLPASHQARALRETLAHLRHLGVRGLVRCQAGSPDRWLAAVPG